MKSLNILPTHQRLQETRKHGICAKPNLQEADATYLRKINAKNEGHIRVILGLYWFILEQFPRLSRLDDPKNGFTLSASADPYKDEADFAVRLFLDPLVCLSSGRTPRLVTTWLTTPSKFVAARRSLT